MLLDAIAPAFCMCWIGYFAYDGLVGATGIRALRELEATADREQAVVAELTAERQRLEMVARQLNPKSLDPDMAEEKIRSVLGYVEEGDLVIPREELDAILNADRRKAAGG